VGPGCPDAGPVDPGACCKQSGTVFCPTTRACLHPGCQNCCPPDKTCNQDTDCPAGFTCCYSSRRCHNPLTDHCAPGPPARCDASGRCPGSFLCCAMYGTCHDPACKDCCLSSCAPASAPCSGQGSCCGGLQCCSGVPVQPGQEYCGQTCPISDRNAKRDIVPIDGDEILRRVAAMPISAWSYKDAQPSVRHIGPMAQDFRAAFGTGESDRCIPTVDANGVALAAIQALNRHLDQLDQATRALREENAGLRGEIKRLRKMRH